MRVEAAGMASMESKLYLNFRGFSPWSRKACFIRRGDTVGGSPCKPLVRAPRDSHVLADAGAQWQQDQAHQCVAWGQGGQSQFCCQNLACTITWKEGKKGQLKKKKKIYNNKAWDIWHASCINLDISYLWIIQQHVNWYPSVDEDLASGLHVITSHTQKDTGS